MLSLWQDEAAAACRNDLELRAYTSRLLGQDRTLVLHGGGNTSVKITAANILGEEETILYVKGSGGDLASITTAGFPKMIIAMQWVRNVLAARGLNPSRAAR